MNQHHNNTVISGSSIAQDAYTKDYGDDGDEDYKRRPSDKLDKK